MEFDIEVKHGWQGHVEITDYAKEYGQYYDEDVELLVQPDKFKYSQSRTINVITKIDSDEVKLLDVLLDEHDKDVETLAFDVKKDGYYTVTHVVLPTFEWLFNQVQSVNSILPNYEVVYYMHENDIVKRTVTTQKIEDSVQYSLGEEQIASVRELIERNVEGTTIQKCKVDIFYTGYLQECYINYCRQLFNELMAHCRPNCRPKDSSETKFARDFLWMTLNVIDYLIEFKQFYEAQRILEEINYCGGFCKNVNDEHGMSCGCNTRPKGCGCGKS